MNDCQQRASLYIIVMNWRKKRAVNCNNKCVEYVDCNGSLHSLMCIPTHCMLYERGRSADLGILCNSGRSFIAFWLPYFVVCLFYISLFVSFIVLISCLCDGLSLSFLCMFWLFCVNAVIRRLFNPLRRGHSHTIICLTSFVCCAYLVCVPQIIFCYLFSSLYTRIACMQSL